MIKVEGNGMKEVVKLQDVTKIYRMGEVDLRALDGVSLKIMPSENLSIIGPSGSGKSTLLHLMGCLDRPTSGKIYIDGVDTSQLNSTKLAEIRRYKIGFVFQFFYLIPTLNALENVELPMMFAGVEEGERKKRATELLELVNLKERMKHRPAELSGGERQRVAIARALANNPKIVLADEPTGNLDSRSGREIIELLRRLNEEKGVTLVIVTHDPYIASTMSRTIYLKDGRIVKEERRQS
ncbi:MAG: ABC transporter ATP-binding protein [Candidatus Hadarchaeum sp.]|uniref:ABC transporter ATP-binding protein n=1 Tax=Candidatus Hadarchaeum sp. TaxID=2883567 RepID=UPI003D14C06C